MRVLLLSVLSLAAAVPASAQFGFSPMVGYDLDAEAPTVGVAVELGLAVTSLPLSPAIRPSIEYVFVDSDVSFVRFDADLIGRFEATPTVLPYAKAGLTVEVISVDVDGANVDNSDTDIGLNLGGGIEFSRIFVEGAVGVGSISNLRVRAGYRF